MAQGASGGAKYGVDRGNSKGMPQGKSGGNLMNQTPPTKGGQPPKCPMNTNSEGQY